MWLGMLFMKRCTELILFFCVFLMTSCASQPEVQKPLKSKAFVLERKAEQLLAEGKYPQAARLFQHLADQPSAEQNRFRLQAGQVLVELGRDNEAKAYADSIIPMALNLNQRNQLYLLYAQIHLNSGNAEQAVNRLHLIVLSALSLEQKRLYHEVAAFAYALTGQLIDSVHERIVLGKYLEAAEEKENNIAILEVLELLPMHTLQGQVVQYMPDIYSGWIKLALITRQVLIGSPEFDQAIELWQQQYPEHPANSLIRSGYFVVADAELTDIRDIAVFLPESGAYVRHAKAIKAGFMAAYYQHETDALRPNIHFYDTQKASILTLYHQAISDGMQLVIGPLNKKLIKELVGSGDLTVPVLALNHVEGLVKKNLYQFALSPIDEVRQLVNQAWFKGYKNAIILSPETAEGKRLANYFQGAWEALDGNVLAVQTFDPELKDFSEPVKQMLNIKESEYRFQGIGKIVGDVGCNLYKQRYVGEKCYARRRQDVDVIFLVAANKVARLINPQFYHNRAGNVPVYGLSRIYGGHPDVKRDIDLENVSFCSIPWLFGDAYQGDLDMQTLRDTWEQFPDSFLSLVAFGIDAYTLVPHLSKLDVIQYHGATGDLLLNEYNRIERRLLCAKFMAGEAQIIETTKGMAEGYEGIATTPVPTATDDAQYRIHFD